MLHRLCSLGYAEMMLPNHELEIFLVIERHFYLCFEILKISVGMKRKVSKSSFFLLTSAIISSIFLIYHHGHIFFAIADMLVFYYGFYYGRSDLFRFLAKNLLWFVTLVVQTVYSGFWNDGVRILIHTRNIRIPNCSSIFQYGMK